MGHLRNFLKGFYEAPRFFSSDVPEGGFAVTDSELLRECKKEFKQKARVRPRFSLPADLRVGVDGEAEEGELPRT